MSDPIDDAITAPHPTGEHPPIPEAEITSLLAIGDAPIEILRGVAPAAPIGAVRRKLDEMAARGVLERYVDTDRRAYWRLVKRPRTRPL